MPKVVFNKVALICNQSQHLTLATFRIGLVIENVFETASVSTETVPPSLGYDLTGLESHRTPVLIVRSNVVNFTSPITDPSKAVYKADVDYESENWICTDQGFPKRVIVGCTYCLRGYETDRFVMSLSLDSSGVDDPWENVTVYKPWVGTSTDGVHLKIESVWPEANKLPDADTVSKLEF